MEEANKIYMHGLHRSLFNRTLLIVGTVERISRDPTSYANEVDATLLLEEVSQVVPKLEHVEREATGIVKGALTAMLDLQIYLTSIVQVISSTTFENCSMIQIVISKDQKDTAEQNRLRMVGQKKEA